MAMNAGRMADEWFSPRSKKDKTRHLIEKMQAEKSPEERIPAIVELGTAGDYSAIGSLIECCRDKDPEIRRNAIVGLQNLRSGRAVSVLIDRLQDKNEQPEIRKNAAAALASIRSYRAMQELRARFADGDEDRDLRSFIGDELDGVQTLVNVTREPAPSSQSISRVIESETLRGRAISGAES
jgi:HEAT repeat protein